MEEAKGFGGVGRKGPKFLMGKKLVGIFSRPKE